MPRCASVARKTMIDRTSKPGVSRLAGVPGISGGGVIASRAWSRTPI
jgi:hypothetical protein